ncbi:hypothetical protein EV651_101437 [Kribbella sp. VKM Ac-2571]|nr:hypothetical protein EV651_101437 [Kribbella sp. VKM Ac-2571]
MALFRTTAKLLARYPTPNASKRGFVGGRRYGER